jgi:hypothetical protein
LSKGTKRLVVLRLLGVDVRLEGLMQREEPTKGDVTILTTEVTAGDALGTIANVQQKADVVAFVLRIVPDFGGHKVPQVNNKAIVVKGMGETTHVGILSG